MTDNTLDKLDHILIEAKFNIKKGDTAKGTLIIDFPDVRRDINDYLETSEAKRLKQLIADREKKMLEFVIGEDLDFWFNLAEKVETAFKEQYGADPMDDMIGKAGKLKEIIAESQRQRAKEYLSKGE